MCTVRACRRMRLPPHDLYMWCRMWPGSERMLEMAQPDDLSFQMARVARTTRLSILPGEDLQRKRE